MLYDIIHVEDDSETRGFIEKWAGKADLTYLGVGDLESFKGTFEEDTARIYVIDGRFPSFEFDSAEINGHNAIKYLREKNGETPGILYSLETNIGIPIQDYGVIPCPKEEYTPRKLIEKIRELVETTP